MSQVKHILDRFSDAYIAAILQDKDTEEVRRSYEKVHPELLGDLKAQAESLEVLYGYMRSEIAPSDAEIAEAYKRFAKPEVVAAPQTAPSQSFLGRLGALFATPAFTYRFASAAAILVAALFVWRPWSSTPGTIPGQGQVISDLPSSSSSSSQSPASSSSTSIDNTATTSSPTFRGEDAHPGESTSATDAGRLKQLNAKETLGQSAFTTVQSKDGALLLEWQPVDGALFYIVELKKANEENFHPVMQSPRPKAKLNLAAGETVSLRVIASSGKETGKPSQVKTITIQ